MARNRFSRLVRRGAITGQALESLLFCTADRGSVRGRGSGAYVGCLGDYTMSKLPPMPEHLAVFDCGHTMPTRSGQSVPAACEQEGCEGMFVCWEMAQKAKPAPSMADRYPAYYKRVDELDEVDVYQVHHLFQIEDHSGCLHHASKKLLLSGVRTGGKPKHKDIREARDTLTRWLEINGEES